MKSDLLLIFILLLPPHPEKHWHTLLDPHCPRPEHPFGQAAILKPNQQNNGSSSKIIFAGKLNEKDNVARNNHFDVNLTLITY